MASHRYPLWYQAMDDRKLCSNRRSNSARPSGEDNSGAIEPAAATPVPTSAETPQEASGEEAENPWRGLSPASGTAEAKRQAIARGKWSTNAPTAQAGSVAPTGKASNGAPEPAGREEPPCGAAIGAARSGVSGPQGLEGATSSAPDASAAEPVRLTSARGRRVRTETT